MSLPDWQGILGPTFTESIHPALSLMTSAGTD